VSRLLPAAALVLLLVATGCGGDDNDNGNGNGDEDQAETTTEETSVGVSPGGEIADPVEIPEPRDVTLEQAVEAAGCELEHPPIEGREHVDGPVRYRSNPPTSGPHFAFPAEDGVYPKPPPVEHLVHSLEHGRIIIQFDPALDEEAKGGLQALFEEDAEHMILTPNETDMPYEVAATAWGHLLGCPEMNDRVYDAIPAFKLRYRDKGPERVA
jgi:hypothetical protein